MAATKNQQNTINRDIKAFIDNIPEEKMIVDTYEKNENGEQVKTKQTISRKTALLAGGGSLLAGLGLGSINLGGGNRTEILIDKNNDHVADTVFTDSDNDGMYETETKIENLNGDIKPETTQTWDPHTAPMVSAGTVNENMSFSEAFAAARHETGAGGIFVWHGHSYSTFYESEVNDNYQPTVEYDTVEHHELPTHGHHQQTEIENNDNADHSETTINENSESSTESNNSQNTTEVTSNTNVPPVSDHSQNNVTTSNEPNIMGVDANQDGNTDAIFVDINNDGSADVVSGDLNQDGQITDDEVQIIHDPSTLQEATNHSNGSVMTADLNLDGIDEIAITDANQDHIADNVAAIDGTTNSTGAIVYDGEISEDMPEDVSDSVLDQNTEDVAELDDNFTDYNNWA